MPQSQHVQSGEIVLVALGANQGDARQTVLSAFGALRACFGDVAVSRMYQTPAFPAGAGPDFVNAACVFYSDLAAPDVLARLHRIEADFGRTRTQRWGPRTLDLDLIACGAQIAPDAAVFQQWRELPPDLQSLEVPDCLVLPHPRLQDRPFVLIPLADVAPHWRHPVLGQTVLEMLSDHSVALRADVVVLT